VLYASSVPAVDVWDMSRHDSATRTTIRCLSFAILGLQLTAGAAVAHAQLAGSATQRTTTTTTAALQANIELEPAALPAVAAEPTLTPTTSPAPAAPAPAPEPAPDPVPIDFPVDVPAPDPIDRIQALFQSAVPAEWRAAIPVQFELIDGNTSYGSSDGTIRISSDHANGRESLLTATIAHEFGHLIAFRYGSQAFSGAAPEGWPSYSDAPEEAWADCVSRALTGYDLPSHGLPSCDGDSLSWTADWVASGPATHPQTRR
jgi:hypothetical protein